MTGMSDRNNFARDASLSAGRRRSPRGSMTMTWRRLLRGSGHRWLLENDRQVLFHGIVSIDSPRRRGAHRPGMAGWLAIQRWRRDESRPRQIMTPHLQGI